MIKNEVMLVTTTDTANSEENLITRIYDVADLVVITQPMQGGGQGGGQFGGGGGGGQFGGGGGMGGMGGGGGGQFGGGGFMSLPPEPAAEAEGGIKLNNGSLKKKPVK